MPWRERSRPTAPTGAESAAAWCRGLVRVYRADSGEVQALRGIDADFPRGAVTAVVGPSGSGKSSLLRLLAGLDEPTAGQLGLGATVLSGLGPRARRRLRRDRLALVRQRPSDNVVPYLSVRDHLLQAQRGAGGDVVALLERLGLAARAEHLPRQLSGGEQQRLAFAQAAVRDVEVVIADEPTASLDHHTAQGLLEVVAAIARRGAAVVLSTHDPEIAALADLVLTVRDGALATTQDRALPGERAVVDGVGRIQLPPAAVDRFAGGAWVTDDGRDLRLSPHPPPAQGDGP